MNNSNEDNIIIINESEPTYDLEDVINEIGDLLEDFDKIIDQYKPSIEQMVKKPKYVNLVLSGGSIRGISHIGVIKKLIDEELLDLSKMKAVAGVSAGAMLGLLIVLGFTIGEIWDFVLNLDTKKIVDPDFMLILEKCGVERGRIIYDLIEDILTSKTDTKHINFKQLYEKTGIHFTVVGSCLTTKDVIYYDHINTPTFKVSVAVRISIGMPGFFTPIDIGGKKYIDGAVLNNYPMNLFTKELDKTIGILICNEHNTNYKYFEEYFMAIINLFMYNYFEKTCHQYTDNTIYVKKAPENVFIFNFDLDNNTKTKLFEYGIEAAEEFIKNKFDNK
ncbi:putative patatin-like phospholipase [Acanthamoeba polyphaga mimivirus]|uniref:Patatin-like phospholipase n=1 Tax=Acanthamoeba polyphaga mimivirus Kroon TaxID=3069720 RepID=A0A0G2Y336_9VIRU|nr:putative patatin-like phospholipase [Acanthamoeba polyphaga mimivirus]AKI80180.1 putative patatin-like phospholipase [Acanthamoeba polyphaga mimivirus Kroon]